MSEENKQRLKKYQKNYCDARLSNNFLFEFFSCIV